MHVRLDRGKILRIMGPASIEVKKGIIRILGAEFREGSRIIINRYRSYAVKAEDNSQLSVILGEGGSIEEPAPGEEVIDEWEKVVDEILSRRDSRVVVVGPVESGKSSFSALLINKALAKGYNPAIIDADVGQEDIAPPGFIALSYPSKPVLWLRELSPTAIKLIGFITPTPAIHRLLSGISTLVSKAKESGKEPIVIDTDGWIQGYSALEVKAEIIRVVKATDLVVLDNLLGEKFKNMFKNSKVRVHSVKRPQVVRTRSREDRRYLRSQNYQRFFSSAHRTELDLNSATIMGSCLLSGRALNPERLKEIEQLLGTKVIYGAEHDECIILYISEPPKVPFSKVREVLGKETSIIVQGSEKWIVSAILDNNLEEVAPALLEKIDFNKNKIIILTKWDGEIRGLMIGRIKINNEWEEVGRPYKCLI
ncbi:MAG: hypothetical protein DRO15_00310 [Thermoprotei archaeon]|nr:MAG: hypothetical protein DRO15_00310 [Thermoprotei archaeon]